jgi:CheY-like chemotaxis protein
MTSRKSILIVDDNLALRSTLSSILAEAGYDISVAEDGFSALAGIRHQTPDVVISDLYMPGMSGFELLSIIRRRFPRIRVIAMSGAFSAHEVPPGVAADGFYAKGRGSVAPLLYLAQALTQNELPLGRESPVPIWISRTQSDPCADARIVITCPECLRPFSQSASNVEPQGVEARCLHCSSTVQFALVQTPIDADLTDIAVAVPGSLSMLTGAKL